MNNTTGQTPGIANTTSGAADLPEAGCSKHHLIRCSQCRHDNMVRDLRAENARLTTQLAVLRTEQPAPAAQPAQAAAPANGTAYAALPVDEMRTNYLDLLQEVLESKDVMLAAGCKRDTFAVMFAEYSASHGQAPAQSAAQQVAAYATPSAAAAVPDDFLSHKLAWREAIAQCGLAVSADDPDRSYWEHELRAFDRAYSELASTSPQPDSVLEDAARWNAWSQAMVEGSNSDTEPEFLRVLSDAIGDAEPPITLQQLNAWTDAARAAQKDKNENS